MKAALFCTQLLNPSRLPAFTMAQIESRLRTVSSPPRSSELTASAPRNRSAATIRIRLIRRITTAMADTYRRRHPRTRIETRRAEASWPLQRFQQPGPDARRQRRRHAPQHAAMRLGQMRHRIALGAEDIMVEDAAPGLTAAFRQIAD